jgi:early secretory antigenic target protein ESAT-6
MSYDGAALVVNFARLQETSGHIQSMIGTLESQLSTVESDAAPLVGTWSGEARDAYQQRHRTWRRAAADLTAMLVSIRRAVDESAADYATTERRNADLFR